jgi:hypothetical protein
LMNAAEALAFVESHGIVLMSGKGVVPKLVDAVAGEVVAGSWWGHPKGKHIFQVASVVEDSEEILSCRLLGGKVTFVHRRLWPALVRLRSVIGDERLARVASEHTTSGAHRRVVQPLADWLPPDVAEDASLLSEEDARQQLEPWLDAMRR